MRVYAVREDDGERVLVEIACDATGCTNVIKPNPAIRSSGWTKEGRRFGNGCNDFNEWDYCSLHS